MKLCFKIFMLLLIFNISSLKANPTQEKINAIVTWVKSFPCYQLLAENTEIPAELQSKIHSIQDYNESLETYFEDIKRELKSGELELRRFDFESALTNIPSLDDPSVLDIVTTLKMSYWTVINFDLSLFTHLTTLTIDECQMMNAIESAQEYPFKLKKLSLYGKFPKKIPPWVLKQTQLNELAIIGPPIKRIPQALSNLPLQKLWVTNGGKIRTIPISFKKKPFAKTIRELHLGSNAIGWIDPAIIRAMKNLQTLDLSGNCLSQEHLHQIAAHLPDSATMNVHDQRQAKLFEEREY